MAATVTVTGKNGAGETVTALVRNNIRNVNFSIETGILTLETESGYVEQYSIADATTITVTKSGTTYTFAIS